MMKALAQTCALTSEEAANHAEWLGRGVSTGPGP